MMTQKKPSKKKLWSGWIMTGIVLLFLLFDSIAKLLKAEMAVKGSIQLGYPESVVFDIGLTLLICTILYAVPQTAVLGAILLTGYLGGAVATHVRIENPLFSHTLFPVYVGLLVWGGLFLRNAKLRSLIPFQKEP